MKKFFSLLTVLTMLVSMLSGFTVFAYDGTAVFYNAADNSVVTKLDGCDSIYANLSFSAHESGKASVLAAHYTAAGVLTKMELINSLETADAVVSYTTPAISVADTELLKVFAWSGTDTLVPLMPAAEIEKKLLEELPTATVTELQTDVEFALSFQADEVTDEQLDFYGDWNADFVLTVNKDATFSADGTKDGYLVGQYDEFGPEWVMMPATATAISKDAPVSVMGMAGLSATYRDIYETVKVFNCGVDFATDFLKANDGVEVTLALVITDPETGDQYVIGEEQSFNWTLPTATATVINVEDADFAMNFKADEATEAQLATFGDWSADFVLTVNKDVTYNADGTKDGYLVGQYDEFGPEFVQVPPTDITVAANTPVKVMETAGLTVTYRDIVETVKDFDCGVNFSESFLKANADVEVSISLVITNPRTGESFVISEEKSFDWTLPTATVTELDVATLPVDLTFGLNFTADKITEEQYIMFSDWYADFELTVNKDVVFNANGGADGYLSGQYDAWSPNWVSVPFSDTTLHANEPLKIMATAAEMMNKPGLKYTYGEVYDYVNDFDCGVFFTQEFLKANDGLEVTLELKMYNPADETESYVIGDTYTFSWTLPTATVTHLDTTKLGVDADFAMNFKADEATEAQLATFGDWKADYVITVSKDATFHADGTKDGYLLGQYDEFGAEWVRIPATELAVSANAPVKVLETAGLSATYRDIVETVKDFDCGVNFSDEYLKANDGVAVTVELRIYNPANEDQYYVIGEPVTRTWTLPTATVTELDVTTLPVDLDFALNFTADDVNEEQLAMFGSWYADYELTVNKTVTFNANGTADGYLSGQYDAWSKNWVSVPFEDATLEANTPVRVMETAAALMGSSGLKLTYADVYNDVKDFNCGLAFTPIFLVANPDLEVTLALKMYNPNNEDESFVIGRTYTFTPENIPSIDKFIAKEGVAYTHTLDTVAAGTVTFNFDELFTVIEGVPVNMENLTVTGATYADGKITVEGFGGKTITVTDNNYCNVATATVVVNAPDAVDKWTGKAVTLTHTVESIDGGKVTANLVDIFEAIGPVIHSQDVTVTVDGATVNKVASDWTQSTVDFTTPGEYIVTITDNFYCNVATATITVNEPASVDKFIGKDIEVTHTLDTIESGVYTVDFADLFDTNGYAVKEIEVTGGTYADGKVTVSGLGTITVTATDNFYCNVATATITVNEPASVDKFIGKDIEVTHTLDTIESGVYTVDFADLFDTNGYAVKEIEVTGGTYADGKVTVSGLGTITVTATDNFYCNVATATITVNEPASVDKFIGNTVTLTHTLDTIEGGVVTATFDELFTNNGYATKEVTVGGDGAYANGVVSFQGTGTFTVTATDNFYCNVATATVIVNEPANVDKFIGKDIEVTHTLDTIESGVYTVDFADLFDLNGYAVKEIEVTGGTYADGKVTVSGLGTITVTATDNFYCNVATATITVNEPASVDKFTGKTVTYTHTLDTIESETVTFDFADLFTNNGYTVKDITVTGGTYADGKVTVSGLGTITVTANDGFYCNDATATVIVNAPNAVDKFVGNDITLTHTLDTIEGGVVTATLAELFSAAGPVIKSQDVTVTVDGATVNKVASDWTQTTVDFTTVGEYIVTITDNFYCNVATATVTVNEPANVTKWTATNKTINLTVNTVGQNQTVNFADLFTAVSGAVIKTPAVTVNNGGSYANNVITVPGTTGTYTVTVTDNFYCNPVTATITVVDAANVDKFTGKTVSKKLAYGSNTTTVTLGELFTAGSYTIKTVAVTGGTYTKGATWDKGTVTVTGTGTFTITITDNYYCNTATATLTVADADPINKFTAKNPTVQHTLATMDAKAVSVKLGDIFSGTSVVTGNITVTVAGTTTKVTAADWANATVTIPGTTGDVTVTITDNYYCNAATGKVTLKAPANVTKFTKVADKTYTYTLSNVGTAVTYNVGDLFAGVSGAYIKTANVAVSGTGVTHTKNATWTNGTITVTGAGTYTLTITDGFYCNGTTATIKVVNPSNVTKWTAKSGLAYEIEAGTTKTLTLGDIFTLNNNYKVGTVTYTVEGQGSKTVSGSAWATTQITFPEGGTYTVTITDDLYSDGTYTAEVKITEVNPGPFRKFKATSNYIVYERDGEDTYAANAVTKTLGDIFTATGEAAINSATVEVTAVTTERKAKASVTLNTSDWTQSTVTFTGSGEVTFIITDNDNCVTSKAIVAVTPDWVGNVDSGGITSAGQVPHYTSSSVKHRTSADLTVAAGETKNISFADITEDAVYGLCFDLSGAANLRIQTSSGYYTDMVTTQGDWTDDYGWDRPLYIKAGDTITVTNNGSSSVTIVARSMATDLFAGGDDMDFFPLVQSTTARPDPDTLPDPEIPEGSDPTAPSELTIDNLKDYIVGGSYGAAYTGVGYSASSVYLRVGGSDTITFKVGVPEDGDYNLAAMLGGSNTLNWGTYGDITFTFEDGTVLTSPKGTKFAPNTFGTIGSVYLTKGDHEITIQSKDTGVNHIVIYGLSLTAQ